MSKLVRLILTIAILLPSVLRAQDVTLNVSSKKQVVVGEKFQVVFELNAKGSKFAAPSFDGFTVVGGPFTSTSSSTQFVNGSVSHTVKNTYTFALQAYKEGTFRIGSASIVADGQRVASAPFDIAVLPDNGNAYGSNASSGQEGEQQATQSSNDPKVSGKDVFLKVVPSKKAVYLGEQLVLTYKLYTRVGVSSISVSKMPSFAGAWMKDISDNSNLRQSSEYVNGEEYVTAELQKIVLVPQRSGKLVIDPMSVECIAQLKTDKSNRRSNDPFDIFFNDPFFGGGFTNVKLEISSSSVGIDVKALPEASKPAAFNGAVGNYSFKTSIDKTEFRTNEAFTLTLTVSGTGNVELLTMPKPVFPPDFEVYDPKVVVDITTSAKGIEGTKKAEYLVIPRRVGDFSVEPFQFAYFNPTTGSYNVESSPRYDIHVEKGHGGDADGNAIYASSQEDIKYLGSDIRHIMGGKPRFKPARSFFFGSPLYFLLLLLVLVAFVVMLLVSKRRVELRNDEMRNRNKKATKVARGRLKSAHNYLEAGDQNNFYVELSQALWGYIADKLGIERAKLSMDTVNESMKSKNVPDELTKQFVDTLNNCEFARFAPGDAGKKMEDLYRQGIEVISKAERVL